MVLIMASSQRALCDSARLIYPESNVRRIKL